MFENIKYRLFARRLKKQQARETRFPQYDQVKDILLLYESSLTEKNPAITGLAKRLQQEGKDVTTWGYADKKDITSAILPQSRILGRRNLGLTGMPKADVLQDLQSRHYDLLIDLTQHPCLALHYTALYAQCRFKTGMHLQDGLHDLMIDMPAQDTPVALFEQIIHYLKTIRSND